MPEFSRPTLPVILDRIQSDIEYHLSGANARADDSLLNCLAQANTGAFHGLYGYAEYLAKQLLPDTADEAWLARWALMLEIPRLENETIELWRGRVARKLAERSKIGDKDDYSLWATSAHADITQAWVYPNEMGLGTIVIRCVLGNNETITPDNELLALAQAGIDKTRNSAATVFVLAATPNIVNISISEITSPALQAEIEAELSLLFRFKQKQSSFLRESEIDAAIQRHTLDYTLISPNGNTQCNDKEVLVLGDVTWVV